MPSFNYRYSKNRKKPQLNSPTRKDDDKIQFLKKYYDFVKNLLFNPNKSNYIILVLLPIELILNVLIVTKVNFTEIDWTAYMQEVEGFINGTFNYYELKGDTGPLVYPAGFVYIYTIFYSLTNRGTNIKIAQFIFIFIYLCFISIVFFIYSRSKKIPPICLIIMSLLSHRIHSIFLLRLFNDPIAMLFLYASIACILVSWWRVACILYSIAVSIKMNILLFAPGLFILLVLSHGLYGAMRYIILCAIVQVILGAPFLFTYPIAYIHRSFEFSRQFFYIWTVNWKCVPEDVFLSRIFQFSLLFLHLLMLFLFMNKCLRNFGGLKGLWYRKFISIKLTPNFIITIMFLSNFIGICFSRSLHYQFYVWYYHTFAYLLWQTTFPLVLKLLIFGVLELCWNIYPSVMLSSLALHLCHISVLIGIWQVLNSKLAFVIGNTHDS